MSNFYCDGYQSLETSDLVTQQQLLRHECPVCLGLPMQTLTWALESRALESRALESQTLTFDGCDRCGGLWLNSGMLAMAAAVQRSDLAGSERLGRYQVRVAAVPMVCRQCSGLFGRNLANCLSCGWQNLIECPVCTVPMERKSHGSLVIDCCAQCQGIWLDRVELSTIHSLSRSPEFCGAPTHSAIADQTAAVTPYQAEAIAEGIRLTAEAVVYAPDMVEALGEGVVVGLEAAPEMATSGVELLSVGIEGAGEVASVVVEVIAGILGGLLSG